MAHFLGLLKNSSDDNKGQIWFENLNFLMPTFNRKRKKEKEKVSERERKKKKGEKENE